MLRGELLGAGQWEALSYRALPGVWAVWLWYSEAIPEACYQLEYELLDLDHLYRTLKTLLPFFSYSIHLKHL